jgi:hypothetical protein
MPRRTRTPPHRIESGLLSPDQLRIESERWESLVHHYLAFYSDEQKPQGVELVRDGVPVSLVVRFPIPLPLRIMTPDLRA